MKLALNGATTMKADLPTDIHAASAAGFDHLEIWASKLRTFLKTHDSAELKTLFDKHSISPYSINSIERITFRDERGHCELLRECEDVCRLASEIVDRVGRPNVGLVIDSFHFYAGGSTIESIDAVDPARLFVFHINDAEDLPREMLEDRHRLLPGLGILPLEQIVAALRRIGYDRVTSVEIFRPEYWERDPFVLAREARAAVERALESEAHS